MVHSSLLDPFSVYNASLDYLRGTLGYSYKCRNEETLNVTQNLSINTFLLQVQPFGVSGKQFAAGNARSEAVIEGIVRCFLMRVCVSQLKSASWMKTTC